MYGLSTPMLDVRVTGGHDMVFRRRGPRAAWQKAAASSLSARLDGYEVPAAGIQESPGVPLTDHELRFIGWVLTDGHINKINRAITISQASHQESNKDIVACLNGCGFKFGLCTVTRDTNFAKGSTLNIYTVSHGKPRGRDSHLRGWSHLTDYVDKDLSPMLEDVTPDQLETMLEAMHLGNGRKFKKATWKVGTWNICTGRKLLADRVQSLCVRRGFRCNVSVGKYNAKPIYNMLIKRDAVRSVAGKTGDNRCKLVEVPSASEEAVWCIETSTGTIVTRRNGKVVVMGNCGRGTRPLPAANIDDHHRDGDARKVAIAASAKPRVTIIDFVGNVGRHALVSAADILAGDYDSEIVAKVMRRAESGDVDIAAAMAEEAAERQRLAMLAALRERERRLGIIARAEYELIDVDPFAALDVPPVRSRVWDRGHRAKGPMVDRLRDEGVFKPETLGEAGARRLFQAIIHDKMHNRPTYKQRSQLKFLGVSDVPATKDEAANLLRSLAVKP